MEEIRKKEFTFKGKTVEELQKLSVREFAHVLDSRNKKFVLQHFQQVEDFISNANYKIAKKKPIRTHNRVLVITPQMIGWKIFVYNGQKFSPIDIVPEMLGHKFGEFALTRAKTSHGKAGVGATKGSKHKSKK